MTLWNGSSAELVTATIAALVIPFYLRFVHATAPHLVMYSGLAGAAMATGEYVESPKLLRGGLRVFAANVAVWSLAIVCLGGAAYLIALIF